MEQITDWYFSIVFFAGILGFVVAAILFFVNKNDTFSSRLLAGFLVCFSLLAINFALMTTTFFVRNPHFWRALGWASFSFAPFAYFYVRSVLDQSLRFHRWDFLFFLPAILHAVFLIPFYILPASEKIKFLEGVLKNPKWITEEPESILPPGTSMWARAVLGVMLTIGQFKLLSDWKKKYREKYFLEKQNIDTYRWLLLFNVVMAIFWGLIVFEFSFHFIRGNEINYTIIFTITGTILFVSLYLLIQPSILYGMKGWYQEQPQVSIVAPEVNIARSSPDTKRYSLSIEQGREYKETLERHFHNNHPFRKNGYAIADLSREINIPSYQLSAFINQEYGKNFNELINEFRVDYLAEVLKKSPEQFQFTLEALGKQAGFNSRAAFISAVKKKTGKTPSEFFGRRGESIAE